MRAATQSIRNMARTSTRGIRPMSSRTIGSGTNEYTSTRSTTKSSTGYVQAKPDVQNPLGAHDAPGSAYPSSFSYTDPPAAIAADDPALEALERSKREPSSTSASPAHPLLTKQVPTNESGVGESAAVRHRSAPGEMGARGGGDGGLGLMDAEGTKKGELGELEDINRSPIQQEGIAMGRKGLDAWKDRK